MRRGFLKTKKELQILFKIRKDTNKLKEMCYEYQQYLEDNPVITKSKEKLEKLRECETKLANIIIAILDSQSTFSKYNTQWNDLKEYANKIVEVPRKLKRYSGEDVEGIAIIDVLRRARNWEEHPQKTNQILYRFMADELDFQILLELTYRADILSLHEMQALDQEEFRVMISNSESLHSQIYTLQNELGKIKDEILQNENISDEQKKIFCDFLDFMPDDENIILSDSVVEESDGGVFKN